MKIQIISTPSGFPPYWIRQAWEGIVMEAEPEEIAPVLELGIDSKIGEIVVVNQVDGHTVSYQEAMDKLKTHNPKAYEWWTEFYSPNDFPDGLFFRKKFCEVISE